jgi:hypothetical protein
MKIVEEIINTFNGNKTLDELIFGPGIYFDLFGPGIYIDLFGPGVYFGELIFEQSFYIDLNCSFGMKQQSFVPSLNLVNKFITYYLCSKWQINTCFKNNSSI